MEFLQKLLQLQAAIKTKNWQVVFNTVVDVLVVVKGMNVFPTNVPDVMQLNNSVVAYDSLEECETVLDTLLPSPSVPVGEASQQVVAGPVVIAVLPLLISLLKNLLPKLFGG